MDLNGLYQWAAIFANTTVQYQFSYRALSLFPSLKVGVSQSTLDAYGENNLGGYEVSIGEQKRATNQN